MAKLKFTLPEGAHTFYRHINPDGSFARHVDVFNGDTVDQERMSAEESKSFTDRGMATLIADGAE